MFFITLVVTAASLTLSWIITSEHYEEKVEKMEKKISYYENHYYIEYPGEE